MQFKVNGKDVRDINNIDLIVHFEVPIYNLEQSTKDECNVSPKLLIMIEHEEKIVPYQKPLEVINLATLEEVKEAWIGTLVSMQDRSDFIALLHEYKDVFAWSYQDIPDLNTYILIHWLPLKLECEPIWQKLREMKSEMLIKVKEEVKSQFNARFLAVTKYP